MLWAAATMCIFGFFHSGEIIIPSIAAYDATVHLSWGDVAVDNPTSPKLLQVGQKLINWAGCRGIHGKDRWPAVSSKCYTVLHDQNQAPS